ncbi:hypothetical protein [Microbispora sp. ATCC PTA-5024]|uniref:hypothetical protein n=1 Tax=Microbispora sp. ATCC PTA-5024 TaxID=316330 RepID=UPI0003DD162D|nr:hypothetical protein [Microbispora sp. ATCC PTA-5024]ETK37377.1 hypothetical protein MPTA5024_04185 [Microbispora sp. ATCC PTA-5024]
MIVQWCCKGLSNMPYGAITDILYDEVGLRCREWATLPPGAPYFIDRALRRLTEHDLDLHVNNYSYRDPQTRRPFYETTPFISLSAGCVERETTTRTNVTHTALRTALMFATTDYAAPGRPRCPGWVLVCYVLVAPNKAVAVPSVAEEIRELNHARNYSDWHWQGEVAAKINVPSTQILCAMGWEPAPQDRYTLTHFLVNPRFTHPAALVNERNML